MKMTETTEFTVWKTIKIGTFKTTEELSEAVFPKEFLPLIRGRDYPSACIDSSVVGWIEHVKISPVEMEIDLVSLAVEELGLGDWRNRDRDSVRKKVLEMGFELCPDETAFQLWLLQVYKEQPKCETWIVVTDSKHGSFYEMHNPRAAYPYGETPYLDKGGGFSPKDCDRVIVGKPRKQETAV